MTPRRLLRLSAIAPALYLAACTEPLPPAAEEPAAAPFDAVTRVYDCAGEAGTLQLVTRTRAEGMSIFVPPAWGEQHRLLAEVVPEQHYAAGGTELLLHGNTADLILADARFRDCVFDPRASVWEHAKLGGADFRGLGNEPGWVLEVREQSALWFSYDYGASELTAPIVETSSDPGSHRTTYVGRTESAELVVTLTGAPCADTMADEAYPTRVEVSLGGRTYLGCGRPLH